MTLQNPEAAESGVYGSLQQLFQLLAGLMAAADSGGVHAVHTDAKVLPLSLFHLACAVLSHISVCTVQQH